MYKAVFTAVEVLWSWCKPVYVWETPYNAVFTSEEGLWRTYRPVEVPIKMERQFSPLRRWYKPVYMRETPYNGVLSADEVLWSTCRSASKDRGSSVLCGGPVKLVQTCLYAGNTLQRRFNRRGGAVKHVQACLCARKDGESNFHHCGGPVKLVQASLCVGNTIQRRFHRRNCAWKYVQECQKRWRKQFSPLWRSCEAGANLFMHWKQPTTPF